MGGIILTGGGSNMNNIELAFRKYTNIEKIRTADFVTYTVNSTNSEVNTHDGTMNTVIGLLAKGDQNCWQQEETRRVDMFEFDNADERSNTADNGEIDVRNINELPPGVVPTAAEKAAAEKKAQMEEEQRQADILRRQKEEEEERIRIEEEARKKKKGIGKRLIQFLTDMTKPDEE